MKDGIHSNKNQIDEICAFKLLKEIHDKAKNEIDGKVHIREIKNGHIGDIVEKY